MPAILEVVDTLTDRYQTTLPEAVHQGESSLAAGKCRGRSMLS